MVATLLISTEQIMVADIYIFTKPFDADKFDKFCAVLLNTPGDTVGSRRKASGRLAKALLEKTLSLETIPMRAASSVHSNKSTWTSSPAPRITEAREWSIRIFSPSIRRGGSVRMWYGTTLMDRVVLVGG